jgi:hypothetical protein
MKVFVLLFNPGTENEGIHTLSMGDRHLVLMFEDEDDAIRYSLLLEAQDFLTPSIECLDRSEIEEFCDDANYEAALVPRGFTPTNQFDRFLLVPPETNLEETTWKADGSHDTPQSSEESEESEEYSSEQLDHIRRRLEGLL